MGEEGVDEIQIGVATLVSDLEIVHVAAATVAVTAAAAVAVVAVNAVAVVAAAAVAVVAAAAVAVVAAAAVACERKNNNHSFLFHLTLSVLNIAEHMHHRKKTMMSQGWVQALGSRLCSVQPHEEYDKQPRKVGMSPVDSHDNVLRNYTQEGYPSLY
jgi:hypothetical protein